MINLPEPFLFTMAPLRGHPIFKVSVMSLRLICLYDNAGEHFNPGKTRRRVRSRSIRAGVEGDPLSLRSDAVPPVSFAIARHSNDPQLDSGSSPRRQETILIEAGLAPGALAETVGPMSPIAGRFWSLSPRPTSGAIDGQPGPDAPSRLSQARAAGGGRLAAVDLRESRKRRRRSANF